MFATWQNASSTRRWRIVRWASLAAAHAAGNNLMVTLTRPDETLERARTYARRALDAIAPFPAGKARAALTQAVEFAVARTY